jgi:hypothetical protein
MREEQDAMMLVRAELCERLARMQSFTSRTSKRDLAQSITAFRSMAADYGLMPVVRLAEALERAMGEVAAKRSASCPTALYLDRLSDAIGCDSIDERASEAMIASVSVRLAG